MGPFHVFTQNPERNDVSHNSNSNHSCIPCPGGKEPGNPGCLEEIHKKVGFFVQRIFFNIFKFKNNVIRS